MSSGINSWTASSRAGTKQMLRSGRSSSLSSANYSMMYHAANAKKLTNKYLAYMQPAGENEARNVQHRRNWGMWRHMMTLLDKSEDVPREVQIVTDNKGRAFSTSIGSSGAFSQAAMYSQKFALIPETQQQTDETSRKYEGTSLWPST